MSDLFFEVEGRFLSLRGPFINSLGSVEHPLVTRKLVDNRLDRDGKDAGHHITVVNHLEIASFIPKTELNEEGEQVPLSNKAKKKYFRSCQKRLLKQVLERFGSASQWEKPVDLGLGICKQDNAVSYFRVIFWPFGQELRRFLGLPPCNFHITVGFAPKDVHLYKGPGSLIQLQGITSCAEKDLFTLIDYLPFYTADYEFLKSLYTTCCRHHYCRTMGYLVKVTLLCRLSLTDIPMD